MTVSVFIDGAAGTTGLEIRDRLAARSEFSLVTLEEERRKDVSSRRQALNDCDVAILCLPDDAARQSVTLITNDTTRVIDASTAHRTADGWTYGFPELIGRDAVAAAKRISNPGCYPTGFLAIIAPLIRAGILPADWPYTVNAVSGYSGGGIALIDRFESERTIAWRGYGLGLGHKHIREMQLYAGLAHAPLFAPAVIDAHRGMVVEIPVPVGAIPGAGNAQAIHQTLHQFYADAALVNIGKLNEVPHELLIHRDAAPWDGMMIYVAGDEEHVRLIARLDNLGKGASGAAVQSLNLIAGLPEETGLITAA
ncbi:N-acetyl-gamma-glutamyl-phosphate reductase [Pontixanthobacter sp.]|uniref:N-acetyl-gamma-glutamyl-phosphate reductase n=1 Tax=Pontixanthobacter sp. TaxID=2792078 RepID=UPI003C7A382B